jgi:hypothetical protein
MFLSNIYDHPWWGTINELANIGYTTKRVGNTAYNREDSIVNYSRPVFIKTTEFLQHMKDINIIPADATIIDQNGNILLKGETHD